MEQYSTFSETQPSYPTTQTPYSVQPADSGLPAWYTTVKHYGGIVVRIGCDLTVQCSSPLTGSVRKIYSFITENPFAMAAISVCTLTYYCKREWILPVTILTHLFLTPTIGKYLNIPVIQPPDYRLLHQDRQ